MKNFQQLVNEAYSEIIDTKDIKPGQVSTRIISKKINGKAVIGIQARNLAGKIKFFATDRASNLRDFSDVRNRAKAFANTRNAIS